MTRSKVCSAISQASASLYDAFVGRIVSRAFRFLQLAAVAGTLALIGLSQPAEAG
jgi:hypothetical protein